MSSFSCSAHDPILTYIPSIALGASGGVFAGLAGRLWVALTTCTEHKDYITPSLLSLCPAGISLLMLRSGAYVAINALHPENDTMSRLRRFVNVAISGSGMLVGLAATIYLVVKTTNSLLTLNCPRSEEYDNIMSLLSHGSAASGAIFVNTLHLGVSCYRIYEAESTQPAAADHEDVAFDALEMGLERNPDQNEGQA